MQALPLGSPVIARRVFGVQPDTLGIDGFVRAARLIRDAQDNAGLRAATDALGRAVQDIGLDHFKPFLKQADDHLDDRGGLLTLVRGMPGAATSRTDAPIRFPVPSTPGRPPWGGMIAGLAAQALPAIRDLIAREDVRDTIRRFGLSPSKPADVTAAYAFLWAEDHGPWLFGTPQTGPAMVAMAERVMRAAQADPDLFGRAIAGDEASQKAFSASVAPPAPGSGIETHTDAERALVAQMRPRARVGLRYRLRSTSIVRVVREPRGDALPGNLAKPGDATVADDRRKHILDGDEDGEVVMGLAGVLLAKASFHLIGRTKRRLRLSGALQMTPCPYDVQLMAAERS